MDKKLIFIDLDDTLLTSKKTITKTSVTYLSKLSKEGHIIILTSARPLRSIIPFYQLLGLDTPIISDNGGFITTIENGLYKALNTPISKEIFLKFFEDNLDKTISCSFDVFEETFIYNRISKLESLYQLNPESLVYEGDFRTIKNIRLPYHLLYIIKSSKKEDFANYFKENFENQISTRCLGYDKNNAIYEVYKNGLDKGNAARKIAEFYQINPQSIIAFGDSMNDLNLLSYAHIGVAMINGDQELKNNANYITKMDNNHDGVVHFLMEFFNK